ncbi:Release factor glutamine methyltransferase [compost metagenome]
MSQTDHAMLHLGRALKQLGYRFTTITPLSHARVNARPGNAKARDLAGVFGWSRPFARALLDESLLELMAAAQVLEEEGVGLWRSGVRWSSVGDTLYVHSAFPTLGEDAVFFGPDTYRFVHAIEHHLQAPGRSGPRRAVDIGCGAGPGALQIAQRCPGCEVLALDINSPALAFTQVNAALAGVDNLQARHSDLLAAVDGDFDLIVANPPYLLDAAQRTYRHGGGQYGEGLSVAILDAALPRLSSGGSLILYTGVAMQGRFDPFLEQVRQRLHGKPGLRWNYREIDPDVFGEELDAPAYAAVERIAVVVLDVMRVPA